MNGASKSFINRKKRKKKGEKENEIEYATISSDDVQLSSKLHVAIYHYRKYVTGKF